MNESVPFPNPSRRPTRRRGLGYLIAALCAVMLAIFIFTTLPYYAFLDGRAQWFGIIGIVGSCGFMAVALEREWQKASIVGIGVFGVSGVLFILSWLLG